MGLSVTNCPRQAYEISGLVEGHYALEKKRLLLKDKRRRRERRRSTHYVEANRGKIIGM